MTDPFAVFWQVLKEFLSRLSLRQLVILLGLLIVVCVAWQAWPDVLLSLAITCVGAAVALFAVSSATQDAITRPGVRIPRYPQGRLPAKRAALGLLVLSILLGVGDVWEWQSIRPHRIIVVADFDGPEPQRYRVTDILLNDLRQTLKGYPDAAVVPLGTSISEGEGPARARARGHALGATAVLWGWYAAGDGKVFPLSYHLEVLAPEQGPDLGCDAAGRIQMFPMDDLRNYKVQHILSSEVSALALFLVGTLRYDGGEWDGAAKALSAVLPLGGTLSKNPSLHLTLGAAYASLARYGEAIREFDAAAARDPASAVPLYYRGLARFTAGEFAKAAEEFSGALALKPNYEGAQCMLARAHSELGHFEAASAAADECVRIAPSHACGFLTRCKVFKKHGDYAKALLDCDKAVQLDGQSGLGHYDVAHYERAALREVAGDRSGAVDDYYLVAEGGGHQELRDAARDRLQALGSGN